MDSYSRVTFSLPQLVVAVPADCFFTLKVEVGVDPLNLSQGLLFVRVPPLKSDPKDSEARSQVNKRRECSPFCNALGSLSLKEQQVWCLGLRVLSQPQDSAIRSQRLVWRYCQRSSRLL